jgi:hypothetical protein
MPDQTQEQNSSQPTSQIMSEPTRAADDTEAALRQLGDTTVDTIKKPTTLAAIAGAAVVASAVTFGVLETAVGGAAAYFAYRLLRRRRTESTAH